MKTEDLVGVHLPLGPELVVALLGVLAAGGAYVPLDPSFPVFRRRRMVSDAQLRWVVASTSLPSEITEGLLASPQIISPFVQARSPSPGAPASPRERGDQKLTTETVEADQLAYVLYTSGSTGRPKGVEISHRALANFLASMGAHLPLRESDVWVAVTTPSFDISALELFLPLLHGARSALTPQSARRDGIALDRWLSRVGATVMQATPATWRLLTESGWSGRAGLRILCGGEALPGPLAASLLARGSELWNLYGPTETTVWSSAQRVDPAMASAESRSIPLGGPLHHTELVLDGGGSGDRGELLIGGAGLARGYRGQAALTAERFVPAAASTDPGARLYRTGDRVRFGAGAGVHFLGRADHQVKIRGYRVELGEVEAALHAQEGVTAAVAGLLGEGKETKLIAWVCGPGWSDLEWRQRLGKRLPDYMIPARVVLIPQMPLTPNCKIDRGQLPAPPAREQGEELLNDPLERVIAAVFAHHLTPDEGLAGVSRNDDFFALGGHSLQVAAVMESIAQRLHRELSEFVPELERDWTPPARWLFDHRSPAALAARLRREPGEDRRPKLVGTTSQDLSPLSFAQQRLWLYHQLDPGSSFHLAYGLKLDGRLDRRALDEAVAHLLWRHHILRTIFPVVDGEPRQRVVGLPTNPLPVIDLSGLDAADRKAQATELEARLEGRPFDLASLPALRLLLIFLQPLEHRLMLCCHHILGDGWSLALLVEALGSSYSAACRAALPIEAPGAGETLPLQYSDYALWQRSWLQGQVLERMISAQEGRLRALRDVPLLPTDYPPEGLGGPLQRREILLQGSQVSALKALGERHGATVFIVLAAILLTLIHRYTGAATVSVGALSSQRMEPATAALLGVFVNLMVFAATLPAAGDRTPFTRWLALVVNAALAAYAGQETPFEKVLQRVRPNHGGRRNALFQVLMISEDLGFAAPQIENLEVSYLDFQGSRKTAAYDLVLAILPSSGTAQQDRGLRIIAEFDSSLWRPSTMDRLLQHLRQAIEGVVADPDSLLRDLGGESENPAASSRATLWLTDPPPARMVDTALSPPEGGPSTNVADHRASHRSRLDEKRRRLLLRRVKQ